MRFAYLDNDSPFGMAHRGGNEFAAENTIAAFDKATELGFRYLETDVHATPDGTLVAFHDLNLERVAGISATVSEVSRKQLDKIRIDGEHSIPTLDQLLERFPDARFNIDPKTDAAAELLVDAIREHDAIERVCIGSFSEKRIKFCQRHLGPELCTSPGPSGVAKVLLAARLGRHTTFSYGCLQIPRGAYRLDLTRPELIKNIKRLGLQVHYWTINESDEMRRLLDAGADALISDKLTVLNEVLQGY